MTGRELTERTRAIATGVALALHAGPEVSWEEHKSAAMLREILANEKFVVRRVKEHNTAFVAEAGTGATTVALCLEYDALPGIGHGCGHNLIAAAGIAAALSLIENLDELNLTLRVIGTPAEERGGGKIALAETGAFDGLDAALMVHFVPEGFSANPAGTSSYAVGRERVTFTGRAAHAAASPHSGINAADAAVVSQVAVGLLRQQTAGDDRIGLHVVSGGLSTNIIPASCTVDVECRSISWDGFLLLRERVRRCFEAGALGTGCTVSFDELEPPYRPLLQDNKLALAWSSAIERFGHPIDERSLPSLVSTDMGNVSHHVPSLHPWMSIPGVTAAIHTAEFAAASITPAAIATMLDAGSALASTIASIASNPA